MSEHRDGAPFEDDAFLLELREEPPPAFAAALYERLVELDARPVRGRGLWSGLSVRPVPRRTRALALAVAAILLLLGTAFAAPAVARTLLPHVAPREVAPPPTPGTPPRLTPQGTVQTEPVPSGRRWASLDELARTVGFTPLLPGYLPVGCEEGERFGVADLAVAYLIHACVAIVEQSADRVQRPAVGAGSSEPVTVGGWPAIYIRGGWVAAGQGTPEASAAGELVWREDAGQTLILERDGLIIRLQVPGEVALPREELIRIADSLRPPR